MKTTLDLPEELVREMKIRAAQEGKKLRELAAEVVRRGLAWESGAEATGERVKLPLIECKRPAPGAEASPEEISEVLVSQEVEWSDEAAGR